MKSEEVVAHVTKWFAGQRGASVKLPSGWFGRPFDSIHQLTRAGMLAQRVVFELDTNVAVLVQLPTAVVARGGVLRVSGFESGLLIYNEYGEDHVGHVEHFGGGHIEFHAVP